MTSSHSQNTLATNSSYRTALIEEIQNIKSNIVNIQCRILKNENNLQSLMSIISEDYLMELRTYGRRRAKKTFYQHQIYNDKKYLEKEEEKLQKIEEDFKNFEKERWLYLIPKKLYQRIFFRK